MKAVSDTSHRTGSRCSFLMKHSSCMHIINLLGVARIVFYVYNKCLQGYIYLICKIIYSSIKFNIEHTQFPAVRAASCMYNTHTPRQAARAPRLHCRRVMFCGCLRAGNTFTVLLTMVDRRRKALFFLFRIALSPTTFFSERQTSTQTPLREPPDRINSPHERAQLLTQLLLTPTFLFHLLWITGLLLLSVAALLPDVLLKFVYVTCSEHEGRKYVTPESLPAKSVISRYNTLP